METNTTDILTPAERAAHDQAVAATQFRRTRSGAWAICGPADYLTGEDAFYTATKKSGETSTVYVVGLGKIFDTDDGPKRYGYLEGRS